MSFVFFGAKRVKKVLGFVVVNALVSVVLFLGGYFGVLLGYLGV